MTKIERVYLGHNNTIDLILKEDGVAVDLSAATNVSITIGAMTVSYANNPSGFDLSEMNIGKLKMELGNLTEDSLFTGLVVGAYSSCPITIYDPARPEGLVWGKIIVTVE